MQPARLEKPPPYVDPLGVHAPHPAVGGRVCISIANSSVLFAHRAGLLTLQHIKQLTLFTYPLNTAYPHC